MKSIGDEVLLVSPNRPTRGSLARLEAELQSLVPFTFASYSPQRVSLYIWPHHFGEDAEPWPFVQDLSLEQVSRSTGSNAGAGNFPSVETVDPRIIHFLVRRGTYASVSESSRLYNILIVRAPGWYTPEEVCWQLYGVWVEHFGVRQ
ncbi:MAG: hypothetical protein ABI779_05135 [Acidobacteriota bacterium]